MKARSIDQKLNEQIKSQIHRSKVRSISSGQQLNNRPKVRPTDWKLGQQVKNYTNRSKVGSTDQKLYQQIKSWINRSKGRSTDYK